MLLMGGKKNKEWLNLKLIFHFEVNVDWHDLHFIMFIIIIKKATSDSRWHPE